MAINTSGQIDAAYPIEGGTKQKIQVGSYFENMSLTKKHIFAGSVLSFAFIIEAWVMMTIIFISGGIAAEFKLTPVEVGSLIGSIFLGMIPGSYAWGPVSDKVGRKKTIVYSLIAFGILSLISAFSVSYTMLYGLRFLAGVGLGGVLVCIFPYFEELLPVKTRGRAAVYLSAGWPIGTLIAIGLTVLFSHIGGSLAGWRIVLIISSLAGLWAYMVNKIPESPYWLAGKGRQQDAKEVVSYLSQGAVNIEKETPLAVFEVKQGNYFEIFKGKMFKVTVLQTIVNFAFSLGYWGLYTWIPTLLQQKGLSMEQSYGFVAFSAISQIPGYIVASYLTGRFGRKKILTTFVLLASIFGLAFAYSNTMTELYAYNFALAFFSLGGWGVWNTWLAEIYPTNIRGAGYSWGSAAQRWANTLAPSLIGFVISLGWAFGATVSFIILFMGITFITVLFIHETEGEILK